MAMNGAAVMGGAVVMDRAMAMGKAMEINEAMAGQLCLAELEDRVTRGVQLQAKLQQQGVV